MLFAGVLCCGAAATTTACCVVWCKATVVKPNLEIGEIKLSQFRGKYVCLFFYPLDFTFVCPTEIIDFSDHAADFEKENCVLIGASVDSEFTHLAWMETDRKKGGIGKINV